jgi:hypothetical protein
MITAVPPRIALNVLVGREVRQDLPGPIEEGIERMRRVGLGSVTRASRPRARCDSTNESDLTTLQL